VSSIEQPLTPELFISSPNAYYESLVAHLCHRPYTTATWEYATNNGIIRPDGLYFNFDTWRSVEIDSANVVLGIGDLEGEAALGVPFGAESFTYADRVAYRLNTVVNGKIIKSMRDSKVVDSLLQTCLVIRSSNSNSLQETYGFTARGSLADYRTEEEKVLADASELLSMYTWDKDGYAEAYFDYLERSDYDEVLEKAKYGIATVLNTELLRDVLLPNVLLETSLSLH
jgi:hypothetical protein